MLIYYDEFAAGEMDFEVPGVPAAGYGIRRIARGGDEADAVGRCIYLDEGVNEALCADLMRARGLDEALPYYVDAEANLCAAE